MPRWYEDPAVLFAATVGAGAGLALLYKNFLQEEAEDDVPDDDFMSTNSIDELTPDTKTAYLQLEQLMLQRHGISLRRGQTMRSDAQQAAIVARGASSTKVSWHMARRAIDAYPIDPDTGQPDMEGRNISLYRKMHVIWKELGGLGLAFKPYPDGPLRYITTVKNGVTRKIWDGGHLEFHGPFGTALEAWNAVRSA